MGTVNNKIKTAERLTRLETRQELLLEGQKANKQLLLEISEQVNKWRGTFAFIATAGGFIGGAVVTILCHLLF